MNKPREIIDPEVVEAATTRPPERPLDPWQREVLALASWTFGALDQMERIGDQLDALTRRKRRRR